MLRQNSQYQKFIIFHFIVGPLRIFTHVGFQCRLQRNVTTAKWAETRDSQQEKLTPTSSSSLLDGAADQRLEERRREEVWWDIAGSSLSGVHGRGCPCHLWKCTSWSCFLLRLSLVLSTQIHFRAHTLPFCTPVFNFFSYITHRCAVLTLTDLCICSLFNLDSYVYIVALTLYYFQNCRRQSDKLVAFPGFHLFSHLCHSKLPSLQALICSPLKTIMALFDRPKALSLVWCLRDEWCCQESSTTAWLGARHFQHSDYFTFSDSVYILPALKRSLCSCLFETISNWSKSNRAGEIRRSTFLLFAKLYFSNSDGIFKLLRASILSRYDSRVRKNQTTARLQPTPVRVYLRERTSNYSLIVIKLKVLR